MKGKELVKSVVGLSWKNAKGSKGKSGKSAHHIDCLKVVDYSLPHENLLE